MENNKTELVTDPGIVLSSLVKKKNSASNTGNDEKKQNISPLEKMKMDKEKNGGNGLVLTDDEIDKYKPKEFKSMVDEEGRMGRLNNKLDEIDDIGEKRKYIVIVNPPKDANENKEFMDEVDSLYFDDNGQPHLNKIDNHGNSLPLKHIRLRTEIEPPYDKEGDFLLSKGVHPNIVRDYISRRDNGEEVSLKDVLSGNISTVTEEGTIIEVTEEEKQKNIEERRSGRHLSDEERESIVNVIIDKTGIRDNITFTEEERKKLEKAKEIRVTEIETLDVETVRAKVDETASFQDVVNQYRISNSQYRVFFPASGFSATMVGLTYGEFADVSIDMEFVTVETYRKRMSVIYDHMTNISCGAFENFDDFLMHFAFVDVSIALFGLLVATMPEIQTITLECGNKNCNIEFEQQFIPRNLLKLDQCSDKFIEKMQELTLSNIGEYKKIREDADVNNRKLYKMPKSGIVVEMGVISAYEYMYNTLPLLDEDTLKNEFGEELNGIDAANLLLLRSITSVHVPTENGGYYHANTFKEILQALYLVRPEEIKIVYALDEEIGARYRVAFSVGSVVCPKCKTKTENLLVAMDDLVFRIFQQLMDTDITLQSMQNS